MYSDLNELNKQTKMLLGCSSAAPAKQSELTELRIRLINYWMHRGRGEEGKCAGPVKTGGSRLYGTL